MESAVAPAAIVMLSLLFLKVPVFASVLSGAVTYFVLTPNLPGQILVQRVISDTERIPLLAIPFFVCAGVFNADNVGDWLKAGCVAVSAGGSLTGPAKKGDFAGVTAIAQKFVAAVKAARA